jgi:hypothetical protein
MYQGGEYGHFSSLLFPKFNPNQKEKKKDDLKRRVIEACADNAIQIKFKKDQEAMWKPLVDVFRDLSLQDFQQGKRDQITINFPEAEQGQDIIILDGDSQPAGHHEALSAKIGDDVDTGACDEEQQDRSADAAGSKQQQKLDKRVENVRFTISAVHDACNEADAFSLITPEDIAFKELGQHAVKLNALVTQAQLSLQGCTPLGSDYREKIGHLMDEFDSLGSLIQVVIDLRDKFNRVKASKKKPGGKKTSIAQPAHSEATATGPMDLFFKVRSIMPADDVATRSQTTF